MDDKCKKIRDDIIFYLNKTRTAPDSMLLFLKDRINCFEKKCFTSSTGDTFLTEEGKVPVIHLQNNLSDSYPLQPFEEIEGLSKAAFDLADTLKSSDDISHTSKQGNGLVQRISKYGNSSGRIYECLGAQMKAGIDFVLNWLISDGDPLRSDRKSILSSSFTHMGVSVQAHPTYNYIAVLILSSCALQPTAPLSSFSSKSLSRNDNLLSLLPKSLQVLYISN